MVNINIKKHGRAERQTSNTIEMNNSKERDTVIVKKLSNASCAETIDLSVFRKKKKFAVFRGFLRV